MRVERKVHREETKTRMLNSHVWLAYVHRQKETQLGPIPVQTTWKASK